MAFTDGSVTRNVATDAGGASAHCNRSSESPSQVVMTLRIKSSLQPNNALSIQTTPDPLRAVPGATCTWRSPAPGFGDAARAAQVCESPTDRPGVLLRPAASMLCICDRGGRRCGDPDACIHLTLMAVVRAAHTALCLGDSHNATHLVC